MTATAGASWTPPPGAVPARAHAVGAGPGREAVMRAAAWVWVAGPRRACRRLRLLEGIAGDGEFLTASPLVGVALPAACLIAGFWVGATGWGYELVVTESVFLLTALVALGAFATQLGLAALAGFACGELFVGVTAWSYTVQDRNASGLPAAAGDGLLDSGLVAGLVRIRLPMLVVYLALAAGCLLVPRLARGVATAVQGSGWVPADLERLAGLVAYLAVVWVAIEAWAASLPLLIRPVFTWRGGAVADMFDFPPGQTTYGVMHFRHEIVAAAVLAAAVRIAVLLALDRSRRLTGVSLAVEALAGPPPPAREATRRRRALGVVGAAGFGTLALAGVLESVWVWLLALGVFGTMGATNSQLVRLPRPWADAVGRIPLPVRLAVVTIAVRALAGAWAGSVIGSFDSLAVFVLAGAGVGHLVLAATPASPHPPAIPPVATSSWAGRASLVMIAAAGVLLYLVGWPSPAGACDLAGCVGGGFALANGVGGVAAGAPGVGLPGLRGIGGPPRRPALEAPPRRPAIDPPRRNVPGGSLSQHEGLPTAFGGTAHTVLRHVGLTEAQLLGRLAGHPGLKAASTYTSNTEANYWIDMALGARQAQINNWLAGAQPGSRLPLSVPFGTDIGRVLIRDAPASVPGNAVKIVLELQPPGTYPPVLIVTSFPIIM